MALEEIEEKIRAKLSRAPQVGARVKFDFGEDGLIFVDGTQTPPVMSREDAEADTTLKCSAETFQAILDGVQDPNIAYLTGKLKIRGSLGIAIKLNAILED